MAVYACSSAAYQGFSIYTASLQKSLQEFLSANQTEPGINEEKIAEQKECMMHIQREKAPPQKGILINEVKVQSKVLFSGVYVCMYVCAYSHTV